jgi:2-amino-4-hydroxy-6-hydroxymethyldihydropteridine diphosphokinase
MRAGIALGSNLGDRLANLEAARAQLTKFPNVEPPILASAVYETEPVDCESSAGKFFNAVMEIGYAGEATELLRALRQIEADGGRPPFHARNRSRTLDLDLLYFGDLEITTPELEVPHPRVQTRRFVLEPLAEIRPELILPKQHESVARLLACLPESTPLVRITSEW